MVFLCFMAVSSFHSCPNHQTNHIGNCIGNECVICKYISSFYDIPLKNEITVSEISFISTTKEYADQNVPAFVSSFKVRPPPFSFIYRFV